MHPILAAACAEEKVIIGRLSAVRKFIAVYSCYRGPRKRRGHVRTAVRDLLSKEGPLSTRDIEERLLASGVIITGRNTRSNVSSLLWHYDDFVRAGRTKEGRVQWALSVPVSQS